jgi:hypothetical protein
MRVLSDAIVQRREEGGWFAMTREPATAGEILVLDVAFDEGTRGVKVMVTDSRPVMVNGAVRHGFVLLPLTEDSVTEAGGGTQ